MTTTPDDPTTALPGRPPVYMHLTLCILHVSKIMAAKAAFKKSNWVHW